MNGTTVELAVPPVPAVGTSRLRASSIEVTPDFANATPTSTFIAARPIQVNLPASTSGV